MTEREGHPATLEDLGSGTALEHAADGKRIVERVRTGDVLLDLVRTHLCRDPALKGDEPIELRTDALGDDAGLIGAAA